MKLAYQHTEAETSRQAFQEAVLLQSLPTRSSVGLWDKVFSLQVSAARSTAESLTYK